jgi:hypothetical protein
MEDEQRVGQLDDYGIMLNELNSRVAVKSLIERGSSTPRVRVLRKVDRASGNCLNKMLNSFKRELPKYMASYEMYAQLLLK